LVAESAKMRGAREAGCSIGAAPPAFGGFGLTTGIKLRR
jgi:hypothetical protein